MGGAPSYLDGKCSAWLSEAPQCTFWPVSYWVGCSRTVGIAWVSGFWATATLLQAAFGQHHNNRQEIVHIEVSIRKEEKGDYLTNSVDRRRDGGAVNEIRWAVLGVVSGYPGLG